ncbi:MAG TPA: energy transducer TonB [Candidatus Limnocylindria bacterium]|nr:energy transducer TonB [Candidatus Limnocylindria bacterium]
MPVRNASGRVGSFVLGVLAMMIAATGTSSAQTWQWQYVAHPTNSQPITAQSTVTLSANELSIAYTAPIEHRQAVIESCRATLADVQHVATIRTRGPIFLVIQLKPQRTADCDSGKRPVAALPGDDYAAMSRAASAINQALGATTATVAHAPRSAAPSTRAKREIAQAPTPKPATPPPTPRPTPTPTSTPTTAPPTPRPTPTPSAAPTPGVRLEDWVENEGLFSFVRVRNISKQIVMITDGEVLDCKNVDTGCGKLPHHFSLDPAGTATIATVTSAQQAPSFTYRYTAQAGNDTVAKGGSSTKGPPPRVARMTDEQVRVAEAAALNGLHPAASAAPYSYSPPRLVKRGTSRLAIGQTGTAQVKVLVSANGSPQEATVVSTSNPELTAAAIETAVSSTYTPAVRNGQSVAANYVATFTFNGLDPATESIPVWRRPVTPAPANATPAATAAPSPAAPHG